MKAAERCDTKREEKKRKENKTEKRNCSVRPLTDQLEGGGEFYTQTVDRRNKREKDRKRS
jgi:hypothetical protein